MILRHWYQIHCLLLNLRQPRQGWTVIPENFLQSASIWDFNNKLISLASSGVCGSRSCIDVNENRSCIAYRCSRFNMQLMNQEETLYHARSLSYTCTLTRHTWTHTHLRVGCVLPANKQKRERNTDGADASGLLYFCSDKQKKTSEIRQ